MLSHWLTKKLEELKRILITALKVSKKLDTNTLEETHTLNLKKNSLTTSTTLSRTHAIPIVRRTRWNILAIRCSPCYFCLHQTILGKNYHTLKITLLKPQTKCLKSIDNLLSLPLNNWKDQNTYLEFWMSVRSVLDEKL